MWSFNRCPIGIITKKKSRPFFWLLSTLCGPRWYHDKCSDVPPTVRHVVVYRSQSFLYGDFQHLKICFWPCRRGDVSPYHYIMSGGWGGRRGGTRWRSWLKYCAGSRKVAGSIPDGVSGNFPWRNTSDRIMALVPTQSAIEMNTRNISWGLKEAGAKGWQLYHLHVLIVLKIGSLNLMEP